MDVCEVHSGVLTVTLWAIDYGFPFYTTCIFNMFPISEEFRHPPSKIITASLEVLPAKTYFNQVQRVNITVYDTEWQRQAVLLFKAYLDDSAVIRFMSSTTVSHPEIYIGDIVIDANISMSEQLLKSELAIQVPLDDFPKFYNNLFTHYIHRWDDNLRTGRLLSGAEGIPAGALNVAEALGNLEKYEGFRCVDEEVLRKVSEWHMEPTNCELDEGISDSNLSVVGSTSSVAEVPIDEAIKEAKGKPEEAPPRAEGSSRSSKSGETLSWIELGQAVKKIHKEQEEAAAKEIRQPTIRRYIELPAGAHLQTDIWTPSYKEVDLTSIPTNSLPTTEKDGHESDDSYGTVVAVEHQTPKAAAVRQTLSEWFLHRQKSAKAPAKTGEGE